MKRQKIPADVAAKALFISDRTCCVCREKGKPVQIHHVDGNDSNNELNNLAILCFDCHTLTQISGGFHRKLDAEQIILYRSDWISVIARERARVNIESKKKISERDIELITTTLEILKENKQYELLAIHYDVIGNNELRDKYIEEALKVRKNGETEIFLRALQNKTELLDKKLVEEEINKKIKNKDWSQLARLYFDIGEWENAIKYYCKSISEDLGEGDNTFSAAFYLKELAGKKLQDKLFEKAYREFSEKGDLWWQIRALQELGWKSELKELILSKRNEIEKSGDPFLLEMLYKAMGEKQKLKEVNTTLVKSMRIGYIGEDGEWKSL